MKKTLLLLALFAGLISGASAQCTPNPADTLHFGGTVHSYPDTVYAAQSVALTGQVISFNIPQRLSYTLPVVGALAIHIDSLKIDSISGAPSAILDAASPILGTWMNPGQQGCINFTGTTTVHAGDYALTVTGTVRFDTTISAFGVTQHIDTAVSRFPLSSTYPITVHVTGSLGVSEVSESIDLNVYPNPNQGSFTVSVSSTDRINGTLSIVDQLGRTISTQNIDVTGSKQIPLSLGNIAPGAYLLEINNAGSRSVKQFIVK